MTDKNVSVFPSTNVTAFTLVTVLFFLWGMSNNLTDILVQQFKKSFELSAFSAQLVQTANFFGYFVMAIPAALLMRRFGYKAGIVVGLCLFGGGMLLFYPAAINASYSAFLIALFTVGSGASFLETAANPLIAQFGDARTSERRLNFSQSFNPPGTILGVLIGARFIFSGVELSISDVTRMKASGSYDSYLRAEIMRVVPPYMAFGVVVLFCAFIIAVVKFPSIQSEREGDTGSFRALVKYPQLWLAVIANFCNVGAQVSSWSDLIPYMKQYTSVSERTAALYLTGTLVSLALGRLISTPLMKFISPSKMLGVYAFINVGLMGVAITHPGMIGAWAIVASSFFLSIMFPTIFALGLKDLGSNTKIAGSFLVMAIVGGAIFPIGLGAIVRSTGSNALGYVVPLLGFIAVCTYGFYNRRVSGDGANGIGLGADSFPAQVFFKTAQSPTADVLLQSDRS